MPEATAQKNKAQRQEVAIYSHMPKVGHRYIFSLNSFL